MMMVHFQTSYFWQSQTSEAAAFEMKENANGFPGIINPWIWKELNSTENHLYTSSLKVIVKTA